MILGKGEHVGRWSVYWARLGEEDGYKGTTGEAWAFGKGSVEVPAPSVCRRGRLPAWAELWRKWWYEDEVGWGEISRNRRTVQETGWNFSSCCVLPVLICSFVLPTADWRCTPSQAAFGFHSIDWEIDPTQGEQRGNKGQLEALDVKESLTSADSYVEDPGGIARWLTNKSASFFYCHFVYRKSPYRFQCVKSN